MSTCAVIDQEAYPVNSGDPYSGYCRRFERRWRWMIFLVKQGSPPPTLFLLDERCPTRKGEKSERAT